MNYSNFYNLLLSAHSRLPYFLGRGRALAPVRIQLDLTYRCNLRCPMCYQEKIYKKGERELTGEEWIKIINQLPKFCLITLFGGEPLVRRDFKEIAEVALKYHPCNLVTNGVLLTPEMNKFLINKKLILLGLSLDGVGKIHDKMRGITGTYKRVIENIKDLQEQKRKKNSKFPLVDIKTVVTKINIKNLWDLFEIVKELEADFFTIALPKVSEDQFNPKLRDRIDKLSSFDFSYLEEVDFSYFRRILRKIMSSSSKTKIRLYPQFKLEKSLNKKFYDSKLLKDNFFPCTQPWSGLQISATGDVYPCLSLNLGNVRKKSFNKIWNGEKFVAFRKNLKNAGLFPACLGCCYLKQK